jgi:enhancing lycopene biosynthesis protein 2
MMKLITSLLLGLLIVGQTLNAQSVPQGMKYQAVARDMKGQTLANQDLQLRISLYADPLKKAIDYIEIHKVITNELGLFSLTVGEGFVSKGSFIDIPWSSGEVWMEVAIQTDDETDFVTISDSRMLSVPYAFHALTASEITGPGISTRGSDNTTDPPAEWRITGNKATDPTIHKLGTTDRVDLVIVTTNLERIRILSSGQVLIRTDLIAEQNVNLNTLGGQTVNSGNLTVGGKTLLLDNLGVEGTAYMNRNLEVDSIARFLDETESFDPSTGALTVVGGAGIGGNLNVGGDVNFGGAATFGGQLHITDQTQSTSTSTGALIVDGGVGIAKRLNVGEAVMLGSTLDVTGITSIKSTTQSTSKDNGALIVEGGIGVEKNLNIGGTLGVKGTNTSFMATIENADGATGDGLRIKLGKTHPRWDSSAQPPFSNQVSAQLPGFTFYSTAVTEVKNLIKGLMTGPEETFSAENFTAIGLNLTASLEAEIGGSFENFASAACNLTKDLLTAINTELDLPYDFPALATPVIPVSGPVTLFGGLDLSPVGVIPSLVVPAVTVPAASILPSFELLPILPVPTCPPMPPVSAWSLPNFRLENVTNSLTTENQYIQFVDVGDRQVGAIRGESIEQWCDRFLSATYFLNIFNSFAGVTVIGLDPTQIAETLVKYGINGLAQVTTLVGAYNSIGVEYSSGFADYAEWLERQDIHEVITPGDIVGVKSGKITRNLDGAEQFMAVSSNPIVTGNAPPADKEHAGNKIAFMGQIPVKVLGPVTSGDFIVGKGDVPGYGVAIHPSDMTAADFERSVGRSWETLDGDGPKMVNTVVGVHNGSFIQLMKEYETRLNHNDQRLTAIEKQLSSLLPIAGSN